jgi:hypothetical protein
MQLTWASRSHIAWHASSTVPGAFVVVVGGVGVGGDDAVSLVPAMPLGPGSVEGAMCPPHPPIDAKTQVRKDPSRNRTMRGW